MVTSDIEELRVRLKSLEEDIKASRSVLENEERQDASL